MPAQGYGRAAVAGQQQYGHWCNLAHGQNQYTSTGTGHWQQPYAAHAAGTSNNGPFSANGGDGGGSGGLEPTQGMTQDHSE